MGFAVSQSVSSISTPTLAPAQPNLHPPGRTSGRSGNQAVASPQTRFRKTAVTPQAPKPSPLIVRSRPWAMDNTEQASQSSDKGKGRTTLSPSLSRSPSPAQRFRSIPSTSSLGTKPRAVGFGSGAATSRAPAPVQIRKEGQAPSEGLPRARSEKTLSASPTKRRDNQFQSPGAPSPAAPPPRAGPQAVSGGGRHGRVLVSSHSEGQLSGTQRMVSAPSSTEPGKRRVKEEPPPTRGFPHRPVTVAPPPAASGVKGTAGGQSQPVVSPAAAAAVAAAAAAGGTLKTTGMPAAPKSPDKGGGVPRISGTTPRSASRAQEADQADEDLGPERRKLTPQEYQELLRCAQQVVAAAAAGLPAPLPPPQPAASGQGGRGPAPVSAVHKQWQAPRAALDHARGYPTSFTFAA